MTLSVASRLSLVLTAALAPSWVHADALDDQARALFDAVYSEGCGLSLAVGDQPWFEPERVDVQVRYDADSPAETVTVFRMFCMAGAHNVSSVFLMHRAYEGMRPVSFAFPALDIGYADEEQTVLDRLGIAGWTARDMLTNAEMDLSTGTVRHNSYWRGLADASDSATWVLTHDGYRLVQYSVDPTYDGEVTLLDLYLAPEAAR